MSVDFTVLFEAGVLSESVLIPILDDVNEECTEIIIVTVSSRDPSVGIYNGTAVVIILDNDGEKYSLVSVGGRTRKP